MPANVVKTPEDERHWRKAKLQAAKEGHAKDWPYIMGIFKRMMGKSLDAEIHVSQKSEGEIREALQKSVVAAAPKFYMSRWPGQVPSRENIEALKLAQTPPPKWTLARVLAQSGAYLSPNSVVDGLGLDKAQRSEWIGHLGKAISHKNELVYRQDIMAKMIHDRMDPTARQALFQRAMSYYRDMKKSMVEIVTPDELRKSERAPTAEQEPERRDDRLRKAIVRRVRHAPPTGLPLAQLDDLVRQYGRRAVAETLEKACADRGSLKFQNGVLLAR